MAVIQFPVFTKGQTLTDDDLNELRDSLEHGDRTLGRLIGFGIDCGLGGTITDKTLVIEPGLAIDQEGQALELDAAVSVDLPPAAPATRVPDFLEAGPAGFTPVLTVTTEDVAAVPCTEADCAGHAKQRKVTTELTIYPGRLSDKVVDFSDEPLLDQEPVLVRKTGTVSGAFVGLRNAIVARLGDRLEADAKAKLAVMTIDGDLPAIQGFKAGFLNQVFFAALDLLRCERLTAAGCVTPGTSLGVALGWAHQNGTAWEWDCEYRHDWQIPTGVAMAIVGGRCVDPCDLYRDEINALINAFEVPVTPAPDEDPDTGPGGFDICFDRKFGRTHAIDWSKLCPSVVFPPERVSPGIKDRWTKVKPVIPRWPPEEEFLEDIYEIPRTDWAEAGIIGLDPAVGKRAPDMARELETLLKTAGNATEVRVVRQNALGAIDGYRPGLAVSAADTIVLTEDARGKVIGAGSVPAVTTVRTAVAEVPKAAAAATRAETAATSALDTAGQLSTQLVAVDKRLDGIGEFQTNVLEWQTSVDLVIGGIDHEIDVRTLAAVGEYQLRTATQIEERINTSLTNLRTGILDQVRAEISGIEGGLKADVARDIQAATVSIRSEVESEQLALTTKVGDLGQEIAGLTGEVRTVAQAAERSNVRIDQVLSTRAGPRGGAVVDRDVVAVLDTMRTSILAAATTPAQRTRVTSALAEGDVALRAISEASEGGPVALDAQREALGTVLTSMTSAVEAAGAPATDVERLRRDLGGLINR